MNPSKAWDIISLLNSIWEVKKAKKKNPTGDPKANTTSLNFYDFSEIGKLFPGCCLHKGGLAHFVEMCVITHRCIAS